MLIERFFRGCIIFVMAASSFSAVFYVAKHPCIEDEKPITYVFVDNEKYLQMREVTLKEHFLAKYSFGMDCDYMSMFYDYYYGYQMYKGAPYLHYAVPSVNNISDKYHKLAIHKLAMEPYGWSDYSSDYRTATIIKDESQLKNTSKEFDVKFDVILQNIVFFLDDTEDIPNDAEIEERMISLAEANSEQVRKIIKTNNDEYILYAETADMTIVHKLCTRVYPADNKQKIRLCIGQIFFKYQQSNVDNIIISRCLNESYMSDSFERNLALD